MAATRLEIRVTNSNVTWRCSLIPGATSMYSAYRSDPIRVNLILYDQTGKIGNGKYKIAVSNVKHV